MVRAAERTRAYVTGMVIAEEVARNDLCTRGERTMKEVANGFMQLLAIIMMLITLAVSTTAFAQMFG